MRPEAGVSSSRGAAAPADAHRSPSSVTVALVVTAGLVLFVVAGLGVGQLWWRDDSSTTPDRSSGAATPPPIAPGAKASPSAPTGQLDESNGVATIGQASLTLPGPPYELYDDPLQIDGVFDAIFLANADVHAEYDGVHTWSATVGLIHLSPELSSSGDLGQAGSAALLQITKEFFGGHAASLQQVSSEDRTVDAHPGELFTVDVHYAVKALPSRYDTVTALVVRLDDGTLVAAISSVPNDADAQLRQQAHQSLNSLTIS